MKTEQNGKIVYINPNQVEQGTFQKHGLRAIDRKPNDYLRMVSRTFSAFRETPTNSTVVSYVNGFNITHYLKNVDEVIDYIPTETSYDLFYINKGICIIDNQLIDMHEDTLFYFDKSHFLRNTKYAIVIEYDYIEQYRDEIATYRFYKYNDLRFPRQDDLNVVDCKFQDVSLDGIHSTVEFSGRPGLVIATFFVDDTGTIVRSYNEQDGTRLPGIDPQYLSKLFMQNYKLLFENFAKQAKSVYSSMELTQSNFINVDQSKIGQNLRSGDMCYYNEDSKCYERSIASRQKFAKVVGLYLNEYSEGNHLIIFGGMITIDPQKYNLSNDHTLNTLQPGKHYYLRDDCSLFDDTQPAMTIENYTLSDSSGQISTRFYPNSVRVGYATACNQILINIDHSVEIGTGNLLALFGNFDEYKREYDANNLVIDSNNTIDNNNFKINHYIERNNYIDSRLGVNHYNNVLNFVNTFYTVNPKAFIQAVYKVLSYRLQNLNIELIEQHISTETYELGKFSATQQEDIILKLQEYSGVYDIRNLLSAIITKYEATINTSTVQNTSFNEQYYINRLSIINKRLLVDRYELGDSPSVTENFENYLMNDNNNTVGNYSTQIANVISDINGLMTTNEELISTFKTRTEELNQLRSERHIIIHLKQNVDKLIAYHENELSYNLDIIDTLQMQIVEMQNIIQESSKMIITSESLRLDIFMMNEYQRNVFNYTYITDRLRRRLYYVPIYNNDLTKAVTNKENVDNHPESTIVQQLAAAEEVNRIQTLINHNNAMINQYTLEYNRIRTEVFGIDPIIQGDVNFDDGGRSNQRLQEYRYGCDSDDFYNGLSDNVITTCDYASQGVITLDYKTVNYESIVTLSGTVSNIENLYVTYNNVDYPVDIYEHTWEFKTPELGIGSYILTVHGLDPEGKIVFRTAGFQVLEK
ncbi:MAG: hypothetical protein WC136_00805 [Sphaerochaeta sp.]